MEFVTVWVRRELVGFLAFTFFLCLLKPAEAQSLVSRPEAIASRSGNYLKSSQSRFREQEVVEVEREDGYWAKARVVEVVGNDQWKVRIDGSRSDEAELFASDRIRSIRFSIVGNESEGYSPGSRFLFSVPDQRMNGYQIDEWKTALNDSDSQKFPERLAQLESHEHPGYFYVPPSGRWLGMATGGMFRIWDLRTGEESLRLPQFVSNVSYGMCWCAATNADETVLVTARTHTMDNQLGKVPPSICFWDLQTGEKVHEIPLNYHRMDVDELAISTDGRWLAVRMEDERAKAYSYIQWYDMKTMELIETSLLHAGEQEGWYTLKFSPQESWLTPQSMKFVNDKTLMFLAQSLNARSGNRSVYHARLGTRRADLVHVIPGTGKILSLDVSREKGIYAIADHDEDLDDYAVKIVICDLNDHAELRTFDLPYDSYCNCDLSFSDDGRHLLVNSQGTWRDTRQEFSSVILDVETGEVVRQLGVDQCRFVPESKFLAGFNNDERTPLQLWDATTGTPVLQFVTFATERAWATVTADSDFQASDNVLGVTDDRVKQAYHHPQSVRHALTGIPLDKLRDLPQQYHRPQVSLKPTSLSQANATLEVKIETSSLENSIQGIELTRLERELDSEVIASAEAQIVGRTSVTTSIQIPFPPGKNEMTVRIVATDTIEVAGQPAILKLKRPEHVDELAGRLFVLTVGVSQYKFPEYNLTYAATDAKTLATALKNQEGLAFGEVHTQVYTDDKATIENVRIGLEWLQRVATEHDVAVVFFSGHGLKGRRGLYYVTHEGDTEAIQYTCLNWEDIAMSLQKTNAKQTLFLSDACHAGAFAETQLATQADLARQLLEIDRVLVFASSKGEEFSLERPDWGHGAFTKALLEALGGQGDTNTDSSISIMELIEYTKDRVTSLTGHQQHPYLPKTSGFDGKLTISRLPSKSREPGLTSGSD